MGPVDDPDEHRADEWFDAPVPPERARPAGCSPTTWLTTDLVPIVQDGTAEGY